MQRVRRWGNLTDPYVYSKAQKVVREKLFVYPKCVNSWKHIEIEIEILHYVSDDHLVLWKTEPPSGFWVKKLKVKE